MKSILKRRNCTVMLIFALLISIMLGGTALAFSAPNTDITASDSSFITEYVNDTNQMNEALESAGLNDIITTITFSKYVSFSEFEEFVNAHNLDIVRLQLRAIKSDGTRVTIFTNFDAQYKETVSLLEAEAQCTLIGIASCFALVDSNNLSALEADTLIYLADTSGDMYHQESLARNGMERNTVDESQKTATFPQPITWDLEDAGLMEMPAK